MSAGRWMHGCLSMPDRAQARVRDTRFAVERRLALNNDMGGSIDARLAYVYLYVARGIGPTTDSVLFT